MFVSILQRSGFIHVQAANWPLQSRADHNTRNAKSGVESTKASNRGQHGGKLFPDVGLAASGPFRAGGKNQENTIQGRSEVAPSASGHEFLPMVGIRMTQRRPVVKAAAKKSAPPVQAPAGAVVKTSASAEKAVAKTIATKVAAASKPAGTTSKAAPAPVDQPKTPVVRGAKTASGTVFAVPAEVVKPVAKPAQAATGIKPVLPAIASASGPVPHSVERSTPMTSPPVLKPGRRSSVRAPSQLPPPAPMVPTHAPDAAKASYSTMTERVIAPPPHVAAKKDPKLANNWKNKPVEELTDEEVKAMPDSEYMNDKQMAFFRHKLSVLKQEIHNSAGETTEHLREDTVVVPDPADRATIEEEHALELRTRDRERKLLKKIEQSIARIDSGDYGYCDETGEPIGVGRLIARPTANLSLEAQQRRELKQKMFGD